MKLRALSSLVLLLPASLAGQVNSLSAGSGSAHLDQLQASAVTAIEGRFGRGFGPVTLGFSGIRSSYFGLGSTGRIDADLQYAIESNAWRVEAGPVLRAGLGIGTRWAKTLGGQVRVGREIGRLNLGGGWEEGFASTDQQHTTWGRHSFEAFTKVGAFRVGTSLQGTVVRDSVARDDVFFDLRNPRADTLYRKRSRTTEDVMVSVAWKNDGTSFAVQLGRRFGTELIGSTWWEGIASLRVAPAMAITVNAGHRPADVLLGLRGGSYTTFGLRLEVPERDPGAVLDAPDAAEVRRVSLTQVRVRFLLPDRVREAKLTGDLTGWRATELFRAMDGRWEVVLEGMPGSVYRINISTDGGAWIAPPGLPSVKDGFGGKVGLLVF